MQLFTLKLTEQDLQKVIAGIGELPTKYGKDLCSEIERQLQAQMQKPGPVAVPDAAPASEAAA